jgi:hypothetical protein
MPTATPIIKFLTGTEWLIIQVNHQGYFFRNLRFPQLHAIVSMSLAEI